MLLTPIAFAQGEHVVVAKSLLGSIERVILFPLISLLLSVAFLVFMWGAYEFIRNAENEEGRSTGRKHILYGIIGMLVMLSALGILKIAACTFGVPVDGSVCG